MEIFQSEKSIVYTPFTLRLNLCIRLPGQEIFSLIFDKTDMPYCSFLLLWSSDAPQLPHRSYTYIAFFFLHMVQVKEKSHKCILPSCFVLTFIVQCSRFILPINQDRHIRDLPVEPQYHTNLKATIMVSLGQQHMLKQVHKYLALLI